MAHPLPGPEEGSVVQAASSRRVRFVRVRHAGGSRVLAVLDPASRDRYTHLVAAGAERLDASLSPRVVANRVASARPAPPELRLRSWRLERRIFVTRLLELAGRSRALAFADVRRCYASITPSTVETTLRELGIAEAAEIEGFLAGLQPLGVRGLPVGPDASAVLANGVLARVDRALETAGIEHLRWVDDVVLATTDPTGGFEILRAALAEVGLRLNERKTRLVLDPGALGARPAPSGLRRIAVPRTGRGGPVG